jgi:hypothetical protein
MSPAPKDYVDVAERIRQFKFEYPEGSLQTGEPSLFKVGEQVFVWCQAAAYRTPDDERPGIGTAWEPVPGPTPFTRDSELMNAETSAWGRAIVALGFETKHIASSNEVRNRQASSEPDTPSDQDGRARPRSGQDVAEQASSGSEGSSGFTPPPSANEKPATEGVLTELNTVLKLLNASYPQHPGEGRTWEDVAKNHIKDTVQKESVRDLSLAEAQDLIRWLEDEYQRAAREAAIPFD